MNRKYKKIIPLFLGALFLVSCSHKADDDIKGNAVNVYFYNTAQEKLVAESALIEKNTETATHQELTEAVINALSKGPQVSAVPLNYHMPIKGFKLNSRIVQIKLSDDYNKLSLTDQIITRASIVYSLTELDFVDGVEFYLNDKQLVNANGDVIGVLDRSSILTGALDPKPPTNVKLLTLYFAKKDSDKLYKETREVQINNNTPLEKYVVEELIKGPKSEDLVAVVPKDTKIDVKTEKGVCQVDFSADFKSKEFTSPVSKKLLVYSIVNSLTEMSNIQKVIFLVDGKKQSEFTTSIDLNEFFERDESIIE